MSNEKITSKDYFKTINIIYLGLLAGQIILVSIAVFLNQVNPVYESFVELDTILLLVVSVFTLGALAANQFLFKNKLQETQQTDNLIEKTGIYRSALIVRFALIEAPSFFASVSYIVTGNALFLLFVFVLLVIYFTQKPTRQKLIADLQLNTEQRALIHQPDAVVSEVTEGL